MTAPPATAPNAGLLDGEDRRFHVELAGSAEPNGPYPRGTFRQIVWALATLAVAIGATYAVPRWHWARPWTPEMDYVPFWNLIGRELLGEGAQAEVANTAVAEAQALARSEIEAEEKADAFADRQVRAPVVGDEPEKLPALAANPEDSERVEMQLENPGNLDPFYASLAASELGYEKAITRVMHYGDSAIGNDGIPGAIRLKMQARFGDAGHGFHLLGQPNASYKHQGVRFTEKSAWNHCFIIFGCREKDGHYGLGGTTFESVGGAEVELGTTSKGAMGRKVSRFELWYAGAPKGGNIRVTLDDQEPVVLPTAADTLEDRWHVIETDDGEHSLSVRAAGGGKARAYGVVMERDVPGVVWDEMSQIGALTRRMLNFDTDHLHSQIRRRNPDLVVFMFGGNDMNTQGTMAKYREEYTEVLRLFRGAKNPLPCLVMAPLDHGERDGARIVTRSIVPKIVNAQREVAAAEGCAFFDTYEAMGGEGSMGRWVRSSPSLGSGDLSHLTHHGHKVVGGMLYRAVVAGYVDYRKRMVGTPVKLPGGVKARPGEHVPVAPAVERTAPDAAPPGGPAAAAQGPAKP